MRRSVPDAIRLHRQGLPDRPQGVGVADFGAVDFVEQAMLVPVTSEVPTFSVVAPAIACEVHALP